MLKHIELQSNGLTLRGYLLVPNQVGKPPVVCMFHGFTGNKMEDHFYFVRLSRQLEDFGIASIRMDFGNSGESDGCFENMTPEGEIIDAINIIDYASTLEEVDSNRIALLGFSMGGMVAAIAAARRKDIVKSLCLIAPAVNIEQIFLQFFEQDNEMADINGLLFSKKAYEDMKTINPVEQARDFEGNVLIVQGTEDAAVPVEASKTYVKIYGSKVQFYYVDKSNHLFSNRKWEEDMRNKIAEFLYRELI